MASGLTLATAGAAGWADVGLVPLIIGGASFTSSSSLRIANGVNQELKKRGYKPIEAGQKHRWGKMTLSLWQQGTCIRTEKTGDKTAIVHTLDMHPIFSGATHNSNRVHQIQYWLDNSGTRKQPSIIE
jgi:hypothetical protein